MFIPNEQGNEDTIPPAYLFIFFVDEIGGTSDSGGGLKLQNKRIFNSFDTSSDAEEGNFPQTIENQFVKGLETELLQAVEEAGSEVCLIKGFNLRALNVEGNKIYAAVSALSKPEVVILSLKSAINEKFKETGNLSKLKVSEKIERIYYLWKNEDADAAVEYVQNRRKSVKKKSMSNFTD